MRVGKYKSRRGQVPIEIVSVTDRSVSISWLNGIKSYDLDGTRDFMDKWQYELVESDLVKLILSRYK